MRLWTLIIGVLSCLQFGYAQWDAVDETAQKLEQLIKETDSDLRDAMKRYNAIVSASEENKLSFVQRINELETNIVALQREQRQYALEESRRNAETESAIESRDSAVAQAEYIDGVLNDYLLKFENRIHPAELQTVLPRLTEGREKIRQIEEDPESKIISQLDLVALGLDRITSSVGGTRFEGEAILSDGTLIKGRFVRAGPTAYFNSDDGTAGGLAEYHQNAVTPRIHNLGQVVGALSSDGQIVRLSLDASGGKAVSTQLATGGIWQHLQKGGWVGYLILGIGAVSLLLSLAKAIALKRGKPAIPADFQGTLNKLESGDVSVWATIDQWQRDVREMIRVGVAQGRADKGLLEEVMLSRALEYKLKMESRLPFIAVTAAIAPLLGLLGTVVGMIKTFALITVFGTGDAKSLSGGISEALVTTELGLIIAIPALIAHSMLSRRIKANTDTLEKAAFEYVRLKEKGESA